MRTLAELASLKGRVALITGGAGYLGRAMASALAEQGAAVALADINGSASKQAAQDLEQRFGIEVLGLSVDLADHNAVCALPRVVAAHLGGLDILVNNAGFVGTSGLVGWATDFKGQGTETWRKALEVNLTAPFTLCREATPFLRASGHGCIINIASIYGMLGPDMNLYNDTSMGNPAAYAASKGGLVQLTRWLATVLAPAIRVNCIAPGGIWRNQPETFVRRYIARTPMERMGKEEDFQGAAAYLASDLSAYMTGQILMVDGGFSSW